MENHSFNKRYREVWEIIKDNKEISEKAVESSRKYFEFDEKGIPTPKRFDTYQIICGLGLNKELNISLAKLWEKIMAGLGNPLSYSVKPENLHFELFLFQRPSEQFEPEEVEKAINTSKEILKDQKAFSVTLEHPFITPDGTIVTPGYPTPESCVDSIRENLKKGVKTSPEKQSQWFHVSLGRILEPITKNRLANTLAEIDGAWGNTVGEFEIRELLWTHEKQWYMVNKEILHTLSLK